MLRRGQDRHGGHVRQGIRDDDERRTPVSIVTFDEPVAEERSTALIAMLEALAAPGVPRVLDVVMEDGRPAVVLEFCGDSVAGILASGVDVTAGEVVTLVAPILAAVTSLHDRGYAHGRVSVGGIAVGVGGRPLLLGCEDAEPLPAGGRTRDRDAAAGEDIRALGEVVAELAEAVADPVARARVDAAAAAIRLGGPTPFSQAFRAAIEVRLFEIAEPQPLTFTGRATADADAREPTAPARQRPRSHGSTRRATPLTRRIAAGISAVRSLGPWAARLGQRMPRRRRGPLLVAGAIVTATVVMLVVLPSGERESSERGPAERSIGSTPPDPGSARVPAPEAAGSVEPLEDGGAASTMSSTGDEQDPVETTDPDDPVAGARAALDRLAGCASTPSQQCWGSVFEPGSPLLSEAAAPGGGLPGLPPALRIPVDGLDVAERETYGDARVVVLTPADGTEPASVLMIRTEAGWRIREAFGD